MKATITNISSALAIALITSGCTTIEQNAGSEEKHIGLRHVFEGADLDGNGKLSNHEIAIHHHQEELDLYDLDNDNHISKSEWSSAHPSAADNDDHFNHLDKDEDGHISSSEAVLFVTEHISFGDMMKKFDEDGDQHLHWEEIDEGAPTEMRVTLFSIHPGTS